MLAQRRLQLFSHIILHVIIIASRGASGILPLDGGALFETLLLV